METLTDLIPILYLLHQISYFTKRIWLRSIGILAGIANSILIVLDSSGDIYIAALIIPLYWLYTWGFAYIVTQFITITKDSVNAFRGALSEEDKNKPLYWFIAWFAGRFFRRFKTMVEAFKEGLSTKDD